MIVWYFNEIVIIIKLEIFNVIISPLLPDITIYYTGGRGSSRYMMVEIQICDS